MDMNKVKANAAKQAWKNQSKVVKTKIKVKVKPKPKKKKPRQPRLEGQFPEYMFGIEAALDQRYSADTKSGEVIGAFGRQLSYRGCTQFYPHITLWVKHMPRKFYSVPVHKVIAYAIWGEESFKEGIEVRHLDGDRMNNTAKNLALGTCSDNMMDKPSEVRKRIATIASMARARKTDLTVKQILKIKSLKGKKFARQVGKTFDRSAGTIHNIWQGRTYGDV